MNKLKFEFDSFDEVQEAMKNLSEYHDCKKCHGKIVCISMDNLGNTCCGYCGERVNYPTLSEKGFQIERMRWLNDKEKKK